MQDFDGKVAVITGGASGIGLALAERLQNEGMRIVLADIEAGALAPAVEGLTQNGDVLGVVTDVSEHESVEELARRTLDEFGAVHLVCNNAGVGPGGITWEVPPKVWEWVMGVNVMGVVNGVSVFAPLLVEQNEGHIVNTSSLAGLITFPGMAAYCASKHAVVGLTQTLYYDLQLAGSDVKVTMLCPGMTKTGFLNSRNWPARFGPAPDGALALPGHPSATDELRSSWPDGIEASVVADQTIDAIRNDRFWAITEQGFPETWLEPHYRGIATGDLPAVRMT